MQGQGSYALTWSIVVHWVCRLWDFLGGAGQGKTPPVLPGATLPELLSNLRWLLHVLSLEIPRQSQAGLGESRLAAASARPGAP